MFGEAFDRSFIDRWGGIVGRLTSEEAEVVFSGPGWLPFDRERRHYEEWNAEPVPANFVYPLDRLRDRE
jgi:hypothetical protein